MATSSITPAMAEACCVACTLAQGMRTCDTGCAFSEYQGIRFVHQLMLARTVDQRMELWSMIPSWTLNKYVDYLERNNMLEIILPPTHFSKDPYAVLPEMEDYIESH